MYVTVAMGQVTDPRVTQETIHSTICTYGWTEIVRPPYSVISTIKRQLMRQDRAAGRVWEYDLDHVVPLELGGSPDDPRNLRLQPRWGACNADDKDRLETELGRRVCAGDVTLLEARTQIVGDWITAYRKYVDPRGCATTGEIELPKF